MALTALITGASQGIGRATALRLAQEGYDLVLVARQRDRLETVVQEVQAQGRSALGLSADVRDPQQVQTLVDQALQQYGALDVLVNNAGIYLSGPAEQFSLEDWHQAIDTNLWGYIHTIHALLPHFLSRGQGTIVNLISIGGKVPVPYLVPYCTTKFALTGLTDSLRAEVEPKGVRVCGIYPNLIKSSLMERAIFRGQNDADAEGRRQQLEQVLKVPGVEKPEDVAQAVWTAIHHQKPEVMVGSAAPSKALYKTFPNLMQWVFRQTFKERV